MKKIFFLPLIAIFAFVFSSCEDESLNPLPVVNTGNFIKFDIDIFHSELDFNDINNTYFGGTLINPSGKAVKYELYVRRTNPNTVVTGEYVLLQTINSFPYELKITPAQIATALGLTTADLQDGDLYRFLGFAYDAFGVKTGYINLARSVQIAKFVEQGFRFNTQLTDSPQDPLGLFYDPYDNRQP